MPDAILQDNEAGG